MIKVITLFLWSMLYVIVTYIGVLLILFTVSRTGGIGISKIVHQNSSQETNTGTKYKKEKRISSGLCNSRPPTTLYNACDCDEEKHQTSYHEEITDVSEYLFSNLVKPIKFISPKHLGDIIRRRSTKCKQNHLSRCY